MSEIPQQDPAATFRLDQAEAEKEEATRDRVVWEQNVANAKANTAHTVAHAQLLEAQANALALLVSQSAAVLVFLGARSLLRSIRRTR